MLSKRVLMVGELSSAARIPLPSATSAWAVSESAAELIAGPPFAASLPAGHVQNRDFARSSQIRVWTDSTTAFAVMQNFSKSSLAGAEAPKLRVPMQAPPGSLQRSQPQPAAASVAMGSVP